MTRPKSVPGEKPLFWTGSSKDDLLAFPEAVIDEIGTALSVAQFGGKHPSAKGRRLSDARADYEVRYAKGKG
jgi:phage-related protein